MNSAELRPSDDHVWEYRLLPLLVVAFGIAVGATLGGSGAVGAPARVQHFVSRAAEPATLPAAVPHPNEPMVRVQIADVVASDGAANSVVLLIDGTSEHVVPLFVDATVGDLIQRQLHPLGDSSSKPETKSLLQQAVAALGADVERVDIADPGAGTYTGQVVFKRGEREIAVDAKLGEALTLAAASGSPVFIPTRLLSSQGIDRDSVKQAPAGFPSSLKSPERL